MEPMSGLRERIRALLIKGARRLRWPRDEAALSLLRALRDLIEGREPSSIGGTADDLPRSSSAPHHDRPFDPQIGPPLRGVDPIPPDHVWTSPPPDIPRQVVGRLDGMQQVPISFDIGLLEELNAEYAHKPIVASPRSYATGSLFDAARRRVNWAHSHVDLRGMSVLEIGCGSGIEAWTIANNLEARVVGIDVAQFASWDVLQSDRCQFHCMDLTENNPFADNSFDRIVSYTVWEHVRHPHALLRETFRLLKPGGLQWLRANLYAGPKASHRYRDIYFPWPHLLFTDEVVRAWDVQCGRPPKGLSWVNRLSMHHYRAYFADVGFRVRRLDIQNADFDEEFYERFVDVLGRFPRTDLRQDFFLAVLEKPADGLLVGPHAT